MDDPLNGYRCSLLAVDDEPYILTMLAASLSGDYDVVGVGSAEEARSLLEGREFDIVLADQKLPGLTGIQLLEWVRHRAPHTVRVLMTAWGRLEDAVDAINCGQIHRYVHKPWRSEQLEQILSSAAHTRLLELSNANLLGELRRLNLDLEQRVHQRTRELGEAARQLQHKNQILERMALTDAMTGLPNRRAMDRIVRTELLRRNRHPAPLTVGLADADHFKEVNSRYLYSGGDHVLVWLGQMLAGSVRATDTVGRIGGEEFMVIAPETAFDGAYALGERMRASVEIGATEYNSHRISVTISVGMAVADSDSAATFDQLKLAAASALNDAKLAGRNRCVVRAVEG